MKNRKFLAAKGAKALVICLMLLCVAAAVVGAYFIAVPLNSGVSMTDALKDCKYTQTSAYGRVLAQNGFEELSAAEGASKFMKQGNYDNTQTIDIDLEKQDKGIYAEDKNPATTYTLADLETFYRSQEFSALKDFTETEGYSEELFADVIYGAYGDRYYRDDSGRLYSSYGNISNLLKADQTDGGLTVYRISKDASSDELKFDQLDPAEYTEQVPLTPISSEELLATLYFSEELLQQIRKDDVQYSDYNEEFFYIYLTCREWERVLPQSKETLADYAAKNPKNVDLQICYEQLVKMAKEVGDFADSLQDAEAQQEPSSAMVDYYCKTADGNILTNNSRWKEMTFEQIQLELQGQKADLAAAGHDYSTGDSFYTEQKTNASRELFSETSDWAAASVDVRQLIFAERKNAETLLDYDTKEYQETYDQYRDLVWKGIVLLIAGAIGSIVCFVLSLVQAGRRSDTEDPKKRYASVFASRTPVEVLFAIDVVCWIFYGLIVSASSVMLYPQWYQRVNVGYLIYMLAAMLGFTVLLLWEVQTMVCKCKSGNFTTNSLIAMGCRKIHGMCKKAYAARKITGRMVLVFCLFAAANLICLLLSFIGIGIILFILLWAGTLIFLVRECMQRQKVKEGIHEIAGGNLEYQIALDELKGSNLEMAKDMNNVREGMRNAIEEQMKSERLKTDLITNVSHDIKTPLTSIINYVDILKREHIQDEKIQSYIEILDRKSQRLKHLTEDLVEASKISSGNIELHMEEINLKQLLKQTNGEFEEKFEKKNLSLVCTLPENQMLIRADGRRMWRVIENLYHNAAKYSMPGTRVYVDGQFKNGKVIVSIKNTSEFPLNFSADELMERFVRGDVSRNTEGSGLGLEIARNLTCMQNGTFDVYLDGDLFKVTLSFDAL